jgi:hypothetical protein
MARQSSLKFKYPSLVKLGCVTMGVMVTTILVLTIVSLVNVKDLKKESEKFYKNHANEISGINSIEQGGYIHIVLPQNVEVVYIGSNKMRTRSLDSTSSAENDPPKDKDVFANNAGYGKNKSLIYYDNMANFNPGKDGKNFYFADDTGFVGNGWNITYDSQGKLTLSATPFNVTLPQNGDGTCFNCALGHVQALAYVNNPVFMPNDGTEVFFGGRYSCTIWGVENHPFGEQVTSIEDDIRLAGCGFNTITLPGFGETAQNRMGAYTVADIFLSKGRKIGGSDNIEFTIFVIYEILPFGKTNYGGNLGDYHGFTHAIPVGKIVSKDGWVSLATSYNRKAGTIRFWVEGKLVHSINAVGIAIDRKYRILDHGGVDRLSFPQYVFRGQGIFTLLDAYKPNNLNLEPYKPLVQLDNDNTHYFDIVKGDGSFAQFYDSTNKKSNRLFGQSAILKVDYTSAWTEMNV